MIVHVKRTVTVTLDAQGAKTGAVETIEECWEEERPDPPESPEPEDPDNLEFQG